MGNKNLDPMEALDDGDEVPLSPAVVQAATGRVFGLGVCNLHPRACYSMVYGLPGATVCASKVSGSRVLLSQGFPGFRVLGLRVVGFRASGF